MRDTRPLTSARTLDISDQITWSSRDMALMRDGSTVSRGYYVANIMARWLPSTRGAAGQFNIKLSTCTITQFTSIAQQPIKTLLSNFSLYTSVKALLLGHPTSSSKSELVSRCSKYWTWKHPYISEKKSSRFACFDATATATATTAFSITTIATAYSCLQTG